MFGKRQYSASIIRKPPPPLIYSIVQNRVIATQKLLRRSKTEEDPTVEWEPTDIVGKFLELSKDNETEEFIRRSREETSLFRDILASFLKNFMSVTDANGIASRGELYVFSQQQLLHLLGEEKVFSQEGFPAGSIEEADKKIGDMLMDVGAGCGGVTAIAAPFFNSVVTTEVSKPMVRTLRGRGYGCVQCTELDPSEVGAHCYDLVMCMNVLDRADKPLTLLRQLRSLLKFDGKARLVLAVVLPWCPFVEDGTQQLKPSEELPMEGGRCREHATFEASVATLVENVLRPCGFELVRWSRLPYISQGDQVQDYYVLSDAVFVLKAVHDGTVEAECIAPSCL